MSHTDDNAVNNAEITDTVSVISALFTALSCVRYQNNTEGCGCVIDTIFNYYCTRYITRHILREKGVVELSCFIERHPTVGLQV